MAQNEIEYYTKTIKVNENINEIRLDSFLAHYFNNKDSDHFTREEILFTRNRIQKFIEEGKILVNEVPVKQSYKLKAGDEIFIKIPLRFDRNLENFPQHIYFDILYYDKDIIVINKPDRLVIHPAYGHYNNTLINGLINVFPELVNKKGLSRYGLVHRIDKDTSGILIIARNEMAQYNLVTQFKERKVKKKYIAIVYGKMENLEGVIHTRIGRNPLERKKMSVLLTDGKEAITEYKVISYLKDATFVELSPHTGRTHQLRVHMSYIRHPILGDIIYSRGKSKFHYLGLMLCAKEIKFFHPVTEEIMEFKVEIPERFKIILNRNSIL